MKRKIKYIYTILISLLLSSCFYKTTDCNHLINNIIFIDPGHGGIDNGTSYNEILEDEINLKLSLILYEIILDYGGLCFITRNDDYDLSSHYSKNHKLDDLNKRIKYIDSLNTTLFVSLHLNYFPNSSVNGIQVFYQSHNNQSKILAEILQKNLNTFNQKDKKIKNENIYILKNSKSTGVLVEYGFLSNKSDREKLLNEKYLYKLALIIKDSIIEYLSL